MKCLHGHTRSGPAEWIEVDRGFTTPCWIWQGYVDENGYAKWRNRLVHRWAWEEENGRAIPPEKEVHHRCVQPSCVRPLHLACVSKAENVQASRKARLTPAQVRAVRNADGTLRELAAQFGVHHTTILDIRRRSTWANLDPD